MREIKKYKLFLSLLLSSFFVLTACSDFEGLRNAKYDGQLVVKKEEAINRYQKHSELIDEEKEFYLRYPFSEDILKASLDYSEDKAFLLEEGLYIIGNDLPAGRVSLLANESVFTSENYTIHVGNMIIRDQEEKIYFENLFHSDYGQLTAQLDFIPGHEIEIIGKDSEVTVFYSPEFPEDPYILMELPELIENLGREDLEQPIEKTEDGKTIELSAGIYEVGVHLKEGSYKIDSLEAPHSTEMYLFRDEIEPMVIELLEKDQSVHSQEPIVTLKDGDKIYPHLVKCLVLSLIE